MTPIETVVQVAAGGRPAPDPDSLAQRAALGDHASFRELVEATHAAVHRLALRLTHASDAAEDVTQETYARAWLGLRRGAPQAVLPWMCGITRHVAADRNRSRDRAKESTAGLATERQLALVPDPRPDARSMLESIESAELVRRAVLALRPRHRTILLLREVDGLSYQELAETLGVRLGTVESRLFRARAGLARQIERLVRRGAI